MFGANNVTVFLTWREETGVTYTANIFPRASLMFVESARIKLIMSYNTAYNVSITATLCEQNNVIPDLSFNYGEYQIIYISMSN